MTAQITDLPKITKSIKEGVQDAEKSYNQRVCAVVFERGSNEIYDYAFTWEAAQNYAGEYIVVAVKPDAHFKTIKALQNMLDSETAMYEDYFGIN